MIIRPGIVVALLMGTLLAPVSLHGQARPAAALPGSAVAKAFAAKQMTKGFVPPKTPWGDPDLQGNFSTRDEANTPMEQPDEFKGRVIEEFTREEMVGSSRVDLQACKLEYSIVSPK